MAAAVDASEALFIDDAELAKVRAPEPVFVCERRIHPSCRMSLPSGVCCVVAGRPTVFVDLSRLSVRLQLATDIPDLRIRLGIGDTEVFGGQGFSLAIVQLRVGPVSVLLASWCLFACLFYGTFLSWLRLRAEVRAACKGWPECRLRIARCGCVGKRQAQEQAGRLVVVPHSLPAPSTASSIGHGCSRRPPHALLMPPACYPCRCARA